MCAAAGIGQYAVADQAYSELTKLAACALTVFAAFVVMRYFAARLARAPVLELALVTLYFMFASGVALPPSPVGVFWIVPSVAGYETASILALAAAAAMTIGFEAISRSWKGTEPRLLPPLTPASVADAAAYYVPISCAWVLLLALDPEMRASSATVVVDGVFGRVPLAIVAMYAYAVRPSLGSKVRLGAAMATVSIGMLISSMLGELALPLTAAGIVWWRQRGKLPWAFVAAIVVVGLVLQPVKQHYRDQQWRSASAKESVVGAWNEAFVRASENPTEASATEATQRRASELSAFGYAIDVVPGLVPHTGGLSYSAIGVGFVPRLVWPEKPNMTKIGADAFTIPLGLHSDEGSETSALALPIPLHGFIEHGATGTLLWMGALGLMLGLACHPHGTPSTEVIFSSAVSLPLMTTIASSFVAFVTSYPRVLLLAGVLVWGLHGLGRLASTLRQRSNTDRFAPQMPSDFLRLRSNQRKEATEGVAGQTGQAD